MQLCGDPTCRSYGCSSEALVAWDRQMEENARQIVRAYWGLPSEADEPGGVASEA